MNLRHRYLGALAGLCLLGLTVGCDTSGEAQLKGSNHGNIKYDVKIRVKFQFLMPAADGSGSTSNVESQYALDFQGYPYNRVVLTANNVAINSDGSTTITPMQLLVGSQFPVTVATTGLNKVYTTTIETSSDLPIGMYVLNAPGIVQDLTSIAQQNPSAPMQLTIPGAASTSVLPGGSKLMPIAQGEVVNNNIVITFTGSDMTPWVDLYTESPYNPNPHPGPIIKTQD